MARVARFRTPIDFDGSKLATVEIDRDAMLFSVKLYRRRKVFTLPLSMIAQIVCWKIVKAEMFEKAKAKKAKRFKRGKL